MTTEQFIDRELQLEKVENAANGKLMNWFAFMLDY